jgi:hypothetical protein
MKVSPRALNANKFMSDMTNIATRIFSLTGPNMISIHVLEVRLALHSTATILGILPAAIAPMELE